MNQSKNLNIITGWLAWHFMEMPARLVSVWKNYLFFTADYFSIPLLLATLLAPWRHTAWGYSKRFDIGLYLGNIITNTFSRILGAFLRSLLIVAGIAAGLIVIIIGAVGILLWFVLPAVFIGLIVFVIYG